MAVPVEERMMRRVVRNEPSGCWLWTGATWGMMGYGVIISGSSRDGTRRTMSVHRVSYEHNVGPIPTGMHVLHRCDVPTCVNPAHLFLGSDLDNTRDRQHKGRHRKGTKLRPGDISEIKKLLAAGVSQPEIARTFGVSPSQISRINTGDRRTWKWVEACP